MSETRKCAECGAELPSHSPGGVCVLCSPNGRHNQPDENDPESPEESPLVSTIHLEMPSDKPGEKIGPYKLLQEIGEGGMGSVWMAEQQHPYRRVAVKLVKLGMDTKQVVARFRAEQQA